VTIDVDRARAETPGCRHRIHFNNCGAALMPSPVIEAQKAHIDLEAQLGGYEAARAAGDRVQAMYAAVARMLNCTSAEIAVVENATRAWDMAFYSLGLQAGDRILTSVAEYASNYIPFLQLARKLGVVVQTIPDDACGALDVEALRRSIDARVRLIAITHVPTNGGLVNPASEVGAIAREHGIPFLLDACQSAGQMPLDVEQLGVDMLSATSRKFLRGPRGCGFLYVREKWIQRLEPPFLDLHAAEWTAPGTFELRKDARRFESWEANVAARIGFGVGVQYALDWGLADIEERVSALAGTLRARVAELPGVRVRDKGARRCGIVSFTVDGVAPEAVVVAMGARGINIGMSSATGTQLDMHARGLQEVVRAGLHYYNTEAEIDEFARALEEVG